MQQRGPCLMKTKRKRTVTKTDNNNVETLGPLADEAQLFLAAIGRKASLCTADPREARFCTSGFLWQFSGLMPLTVSESPS